MKTLVRPNRQFEFCFPNLDTLILVEESDDEVVVRATNNSFSERRKVQFIRELAAKDSFPKATGGSLDLKVEHGCACDGW